MYVQNVLQSFYSIKENFSFRKRKRIEIEEERAHFLRVSYVRNKIPAAPCMVTRKKPLLVMSCMVWPSYGALTVSYAGIFAPVLKVCKTIQAIRNEKA